MKYSSQLLSVIREAVLATHDSRRRQPVILMHSHAELAAPPEHFGTGLEQALRGR